MHCSFFFQFKNLSYFWFERNNVTQNVTTPDNVCVRNSARTLKVYSNSELL